MAASGIEWTGYTWNPVTGCTKLSTGCKHCYAERMAKRLQAMGQENYRNGFSVQVHPKTLSRPLQWKTPRTIFVNSMSDLFHASVPSTFIQEVFAAMNAADWHIYQVLTKRTQRLRKMAPILPWHPSVWMGATVETRDHLSRVEDLLATDAKTKFLSLEPLLGPLAEDLPLDGIDWVIVGGESGPGARPINPEWVRAIRDKCLLHSVPFFFKQWGGTQKKKSGRDLDGRIWDQMPDRSLVATRD